MNPGKKLDKTAAIEVNLTYAGRHAPLYMSSLYGSYLVETDLSMPVGKVAGFRCPYCKADLKSARKCDACGSRMIAFELKAGGQVQICSRRGCKKHVLEFQDADSELQAFYKSYLKALK
ncbi:MAG: hypothetical protein AAB359_04640 [Elusimicrobiota bacterium]